MVRVALVGLGMMGKTHLGVYSRLENVEVAALMDINPAALEITSLDSGGNIQASSGAIDVSSIRKFDDYEAMLAEGGFDYVDLCLPTYVHAEHSIKAMERGYHVFCEKPMALTAEETDEVVRAQRSTGKMFTVGQCLRFWPAYTETKKIIDDGSYGRVLFAEFGRYSARPGWGWDNWLLDTQRSGNAALDLHVHDVDMVLWLFGKPRSLRSTGVIEEDKGVSHISTAYDYEGMSVTSTGGWNCSDSFGFNMRALLILERATIELDFSKDPIVTLFPHGGTKEAVELPEGDGYYHELENFARAVEAGRAQELVTGESAAESVKLCLLEIQSAVEKREISVP